MKVWVRQRLVSGGHRSCSPKFIVVLLALGWASAGYGETIVIDSGIDGNGDGLDDRIRYFAGPADSGFPNAFTSSDFAAAQSGPAAPVVTGPAGVWVTNHSTSGAARWISTHANAVQGRSALYHVPFSLSTMPRSVVLEFRYAIDNGLGDPVNQGLFVNGTPISDYGSGPPVREFSPVTTLYFDITEYVNPVLNHLYVYQYDWGDHAGSQFTVTLTVEYGNTIIIDSGIDGNGDGLDDTVRYLAGPADSGFPNAFTPSDFAAAESGPAAPVVTGPAGPWVPDYSTSGAARWISTHANAVRGGSALYHVPFSLSTVPESVLLIFTYAIDNGLGDPVNQGLFVNGTPISDYGSGPPGGDFSAVTTLNFDITEHVNPGLNHLHVYQYDWGDYAGSQFTVAIAIEHRHTLTLTIDAHPEWGEVTVDPNQAWYGDNATVKLTAVVTEERKWWGGWSGDVDPNDRYTNPLTITMDSDKEISTSFKCGVGVGPFLPTIPGMLGLFVWVRRRS